MNKKTTNTTQNTTVKQDLNEIKMAIAIMQKQIAALEAKLKGSQLYSQEEYSEIAKFRNRG